MSIEQFYERQLHAADLALERQRAEQRMTALKRKECASGLLMQMIDCMIEQDPSLSARRTIDMRRYIVNRWNRTHEDPIDEDAVALFHCDENRGTLTDEQRLFARECREEIKACYRNAVFQMFQCGEMMRRHLVSGPEEYWRIFLPQYAVPCNKRLSPCNGL